MRQQGCGGVVKLVEVDRIGVGKMRGGRRPHGEFRECAEHTEDCRGRIWRRAHTKQGQFLKEPYRCHGDMCACADKVFKSIHLLYKDAKDEKGTYTEHICYKWSACEAGNPTSESFQLKEV